MSDSSDTELQKKVKVAEKPKRGKKKVTQDDEKEEEKPTKGAKKKEKEKKQKQKKESKNDKKKGAKQKQPLIKEDPETLGKYFRDTNRPYTLNYLKDTLHLKPTQLQKNLDALLKSEEIVLKEVGSSKVYLYNQSLLPEVDNEEMDRLGVQYEERLQLQKEMNSEIGKLGEQLKALLRIPLISELDKQIQHLKETVRRVNLLMLGRSNKQRRKSSATRTRTSRRRRGSRSRRRRRSTARRRRRC